MNSSSSSPVLIMLKLLARWWWLLAVAVAIGAGVGYFVRTNQPDIYYARASVLFGKFFSAQEQQSLARVTEQIRTYAGLVRQEQVLRPVIQKMNMNITVEKFNERLQVREVPDLPLLEIIFADESPAVAANVANAIAQEMIDQSPTNRLTQDAEFQRQQLRELQAQITQLETEYNTALTEGSSLTSAFEIAQNQQKIQETLKTLQELRTLYAGLRTGLTDSSDVLSIFGAATAQNALVVSGSFSSVLLAGIGGLVLATLTVILIEYLDDRLEWQENLEQVEGVRVLSPLGLIPKNKLPLYIATLPDSAEAEVLRQLRAKIVLEAGSIEPKVLTITSYDSGDGKSVTAANMAVAAAEAGLKTLLIDGDLRKGNLHEFFQLPNVMGLSDILVGREDLNGLLARALLNTRYENLTLLTSGRATSDPAALLSKPRMGDLIELLRGQFDSLIVDSVPIVGGPDAAFLAERSTGVMIVVHGQRTTHTGLRRTLQALRQGANKNIKIYGVAFNRIPLQATSTYNQPYYRRKQAASPDMLNPATANANTSKGFLRRKPNVIMDANGLHLYSLAAASVQLGISTNTLKGWIKNGSLKTERRDRREWVSETEIAHLLEKLPRYEIVPLTAAAVQIVDGEGQKMTLSSRISSEKLRDLLIERDALLAVTPETQAVDHKDE